MPLVIPENYGIASWVFGHTAFTREAVVTCGINIPTGFSGAAYANRLFACWQSTLLTSQDANATLLRVEFRFRPVGATEPLAVVSGSTPTVGSATIATPPPNAACLVRKVTEVGGRRNRGRMFIPFITDEVNVDEAGQMTTALQSAIQAQADAFETALGAGTGSSPIMAPVILHDSTKFTKTTVGNVTTITKSEVAVPVPAVVTAFVVERLMATQRRRLRD